MLLYGEVALFRIRGTASPANKPLRGPTTWAGYKPLRGSTPNAGETGSWRSLELWFPRRSR